MIQFVQKRDGRVVPFEKEKITKAIEKAGLAAHEFGRETAEYLTNIVVQEIIFEKEPVNIEIIQNKIEEVLMRKGFYQTAKAFIIYREKRRELRELRKHLNIPELFDAYIGEETWEVHENANIDYSIQGLKAYITGKAEEIYWLEKVYPKKISDYHKDGFVHIHNLSFLGAYCVGWDLEDLIKRGFGGVPGKPYSSPAKHLSSILGQMMNFLFTLQNEAAGAVAFSSFDTLLAPFVYFDKLSYKEVKQQIQEFIYNMNQTMRTGGQSPFSNITVDLTPHPLLKDKPVIIGGKPIKEYTYGMFKKEMDLINKALFEVYIEGDGHGRPHSVSGDSMCLIKENGRMKLVRIGDFINALMEQNKSVHIENDNSEIMDVRDRSIETVGIRDGRIIFQKVNYIARHPVNSLLKIITDGGFSIKVTESHSVFVLKNGKIEDYKASELKEGDYLITPRILPTHSTNEHKEISLAEEFIKKGKSDGIYIRDVKKKDGKRLWKKIYCKNSIGHISVFPLSSIKDELPELDLSEAKISLAGSKLKISNNLKISDELIELLGWYSAEGSAEKSKNYGGISLGLNLKKEKDKAIYISELIKKIWPNVPVKIREIEKRNLIEIRVHSKLIRRIFTEIFELKKGRERKVPDIIFELPNRQKKIFLNAYFQGDGHISKDGLNITSISPQLIYGTSTLLKQLGIFHTISEYVNKGRKRFRINIWGDINFTDNHRSYTISKIPVKESGLLALIDKLLEKEPFYYDSLGRKYRNTKERILRNLGISPEVDSTEIENIRKVVNYLKKNGIDIPKTLIDILNDEMLFLKIKKIEQIETKNEMVYDFSTETENFIANNLLVHNTFPIPTLNVSKDFDWDNPVLEPVWEATAKYGTPYFCLEEKTKIVTKNGIKEIKDIEAGDEVLSDNGNFAKVTHVEKIVSKENIVIEGDNFNIICSPNHRFPTDNGIKRADELSLRDRLLLYKEKIILENGMVIDHRTRQFFELEDISSLTKKEFVKLTPKRIIKEIPPFKFNGNRWQTTLNNDIRIPEDLNEDIMELFGIVIGDGSIQEKSPSIRVVNADKEIIDFVTKTFEKEFNVKPYIRQAGHSKVCKDISVNSRIVVDFFKYYGISGTTHTKKIPEALFFRNEKEIGALLRGLFDTDGSIHINNNEQPIISISFSNEKLMEDTILLLAKIGIVGKFNKNGHGEKRSIVITGRRNIEMFKRKVGFRVKRKAEKLDYETKIDRPSIGDKIVSKEEGEKFSEAYRRNPEYKDAKWVRIISDNEEPYLFIEKIEKGIEKVKINKISYDHTEHNLVDITVDSPNHLFVLENGIISHNSNYINSDLRPEDARSMCIDGNEEILIREGGIIKRLTLRDLVEGYKASEFDEDGWTEPKKHLEALSLNPKTMKMEWIPIKSFLKIKDSAGVKVTTDDGRTISFSQKHPMAVYTEKGIQMRFAKDVKKGDKFLSLSDVNYTEDSKVNIVEVKQVELETFIEQKEFYDIELTENHLFALANGLISFNCCRLRLETRELKSKGGGLFGANPLTGSTGVITINMPRIGYLAKTEEEFFSILDDIMDAAKEGLEKKRETVEKFTEMGLYPYSRIYLDSIKESTGHYWSNHFSTIGLIGMNEALMNFFERDVHMGTQKGIEFAVKVLEHMRNKLRKYQEETDHLFNLEATPAESTAYSLALKDKKLYPDIITAGTEENPYYTNSTQLPVGFTDDPFEVAALQEPVQKLYTGGCIEKGNKVLTDKGLLPIEYIVENFSHLKPIKALSYNKDKNISEWDEIVEAVKIDVSKENKIRVKGEKGLDIVTSDWHPFFVLEEIKPDTECPVCGTKVNGIKGFAAHLRHNPTCREKYISMDKFRVVEKRADELKVGDYILQNSFNMYPDKESELDENLMWLIGFFIGNGSISKSIDNRGGNHLEKYYIRFFSESQRGLEKAASILNNYFGCFVNVIKNDKRSDALREVTTSKKEVIDFFFKYGFGAGEKVYDIYVPEKVKENITQKNVYAFISGLIDSHGTIGKREGDLEYDTVSERLANDILEIFTKAGILATKTLKKTKRENEKDIFRIRLPQYELTRIKEKLGIEANLDRVKNNFSDRVRRQLPVVRVKEISKVDVEDNEFYDLMTKNNHNYLAGKNCLVFVHNTVVHFFLGERLTNPNSAKIFVRKILENFEIPYITLTPSFSICPKHGYIPGEHEFCPYCDEELKEKARKGELENNKKSGKIDIDLKIDI